MISKSLIASVFLGLLTATASSAATVDFDGGPPGGVGYTEEGMTFDDARIVNGRCVGSSSGAPCMALNNNETSTMTQVGGGAFNFTGFWFQLLGNGTDNTLILTSNLGANILYPRSVWGNNDGGQFISLVGNSLFENVTSISFATNNGGNVRVDDIGVSEVPLPAAGWLLLAGLGSLFAMRRRSKA